MDAVRNPYVPGAGSPPPELAGRADILERTTTALLRVAQRKPIAFPILVGLRGVGKTVLLVRTREFADGEGFLTIDVEAHENKSLPELLLPGMRKALYALSALEGAKEKARRGLRVLKSFMSGIKISYEGFELGLDAESGTADSGDLESDLPEMFTVLGEAAASANRPVAVIIDELQYLSQGEFSALIMSMHRMSQRSLPVVLIGAGLPQVRAIAGNSKSYSERLFAYSDIGALSDGDAIDAITNPAREEGVHFEASAVAEILSLTERYPYFLQQWSHDAWNVASGDKITGDDVARATPISVSTLDQSFFHVRFDRCTPTEKTYMRALAEMGPGHHRSGDVADKLNISTTSAAPARNSLIKKGMIYSPSYGDTAFTVPLFDDYMKRAMPIFAPKKRKQH